MARIALDEHRFTTEASEQEYRGLEAGDILFFPTSPPLVTEEEQRFLLTQRQSGSLIHKNISYRPVEDRLKGVDQKESAELVRVHDIMRSFSSRSIAFMASFLGVMHPPGRLTTQVSDRSRNKAAGFPCIRAMTCCTLTRSRPGRRTATGCCGSS